jgi:HlyD family secretion protein
MLRNRKWLILTLTALVLALGIYKFTSKSSKPERKYETAKIERGRIVAKVTATGTLSALVTVQVGSQVSGRIQKLFVDFNDKVKKGQVLAKIDPQLFAAALEQARANYMAAQSNLKKAQVQMQLAERQLARSKSLADRKLIALADFDTAQSDFDVAKAQVESIRGSMAQARAGLTEAQVNLDYTTIVSPINGSVISRNVDVGQTVAASLQAPTLFVLAEDLAKMQVDTNVAEADVGKLRSGMQAVFTVDAFPNEKFIGTVRQIRNAAQMVQNVVTYDAVIDVSNPDLKLKPGMTCNVTFVYAEKDAVLKIPNAALRFRPPEDLGGTNHYKKTDNVKKTIWLLVDNTPKMANIETGISDGSLTELIAGDVREGDRVITDILGSDKNSTNPGPGGMRRIF